MAFYSRKLTGAQKNYTTTEKELLSIVETLNEFRTILLGYKIKIFTDHKNLTYETTPESSQRRKRWESLIQEFGPEMIHIAGANNTVADALSRLPMKDRIEKYISTPKEDRLELLSVEHRFAKSLVYTLTESQQSDSYHDVAEMEDAVCALFEVNELFVTNTNDCFVSVSTEEISYPLAPQIVEEEQIAFLSNVENTQANKIKLDIRKNVLDPKTKRPVWSYVEVEKRKLLHLHDRIFVPPNLRSRVITWYHHYLIHPGGDRLAQTLRTVCAWNGLTNQCRQYCKRCKTCQKHKPRNKKYGHLPPKDQYILVPWDTLCVDLVGPYSLTAQVQQMDGTVKEMQLKLLAMTFIDPATGCFEIAEVVDDKSSAAISQLLDQTWLARYPRPREIIFDNGTEFKKDFLPLLKDLAIKPKCTTIKNPQANSIIERIHQVTGGMLKCKDLKNQIFDIRDVWGPTLSSIIYAVRCSYHSTLGATPGQLVFGRDMLLDISFDHDYQQAWAKKQRQIIKDNQRENSKRVPHDYVVGEKAYVTSDEIGRKLDGEREGPYRIIRVHANGTVVLQKGITEERINIRRLTPHFE